VGGGRALWLADPLSGAPGWARAESGGETRAVRAAGAMQGDRAQAPLACASDAAAGEAQQQPADQKERARQLLMRFSAEIALVVFEAKLGSAVLDSPRLTAEEFANVPVDVLPDEFVEAAGNPCSPDVALGHLSALRELEGTQIQQGKSNVEFKNAFSLTSASRALQHNGYDEAQSVLLSQLVKSRDHNPKLAWLRLHQGDLEEDQWGYVAGVEKSRVLTIRVEKCRVLKGFRTFPPGALCECEQCRKNKGKTPSAGDKQLREAHNQAHRAQRQERLRRFTELMDAAFTLGATRRTPEEIQYVFSVLLCRAGDGVFL